MRERVREKSKREHTHCSTDTRTVPQSLTLMAVWEFSEGALYGPTANMAVKLSPACREEKEEKEDEEEGSEEKRCGMSKR